GDEQVVDVEEKTQTIALAAELGLVLAGLIEVDRVVDRHGDVGRHLLHECDHIGAVVVVIATAETEHTDAAMDRCERKKTSDFVIVLAEEFERDRKRTLVRNRDDRRLLRFPYDSGRT